VDALQESATGASRSTKAPRPGWPRVIGTIGTVLGILIFVDQIDDIWIGLTWTEEDWQQLFAPRIAELMTAALRPKGWQLASIAIQMGLGLMLVAGSIGLHKRRRSGVALCRSWAWLAIAWAAADIGRAVWLLFRYTGEIPGTSIVSGQTAATLGIGFALVLLLAFPVFLLVWLARPEVKTEYSSWIH
jgi:hypothetical protein